MEWPDGITYRPIEQWPGALTRNRKMSPFSAPLRRTLTAFRQEVRLIRAKSVVIQIALREEQFRIDGAPRAAAVPEHPGVILSLDTADGALSFPCDTYTHWHDNLRAIVLTMEKLRAIDRYGVTKRGEQYTGWKALPATATAMPGSFTNEGDVRALLERIVGGTVEALGWKTMLRRAQAATHSDHAGAELRDEWDRVSLAEAYLREHELL